MRLKSCTWRPVSFVGVTPSQRGDDKAAILHTNGAPAPSGLFNFYQGRAQNGSTEMAHIQVQRDGTAEQYVDTDLRVGHAWDGNFAIGIETEDRGHPSEPWTLAQQDKLVAILNEIRTPAVILKENGGDGVGWHQLYPSWNQSHHNCPGPVRVDQITTVIIPALKGDDVTQDEFNAMLEKANGIGVNRQKNLGFAIGVQRFVAGDDRPTDKEQQPGWDWAKKVSEGGGGTPGAPFDATITPR